MSNLTFQQSCKSYKKLQYKNVLTIGEKYNNPSKDPTI